MRQISLWLVSGIHVTSYQIPGYRPVVSTPEGQKTKSNTADQLRNAVASDERISSAASACSAAPRLRHTQGLRNLLPHSAVPVIYFLSQNRHNTSTAILLPVFRHIARHV